jgi:hypothetical protein
MRPDAGRQPGVDLDRSCTCARDLYDGAPPCETPGSPVRCDFEGGIDDSFALLDQVDVSSFLDLSNRITRDIVAGRRTVLIYIGNYNGLANDQDVSAAFVTSGGLYSDLGCDGGDRDASRPQGHPDGAPGDQHLPVWDGCDRWSPNPGLVTAGSPNIVATAYVSNYTLVAQIKEVTVEIFGGPVKAGNATAVLHLAHEGDGLRADGFIAGRIAVAELAGAIGRIPGNDTYDGVPLCQTPFWPALGPALCQARDTTSSPSLDHKGAICDAITSTIGFTARPAQVSDETYSNPTLGYDCPGDLQCNCGQRRRGLPMQRSPRQRRT